MKKNRYGRRGIAVGVTNESKRTITRARETKNLIGSIRNVVAVIVKLNVAVVEQTVAVEDLNVEVVE